MTAGKPPGLSTTRPTSAQLPTRLPHGGAGGTCRGGRSGRPRRLGRPGSPSGWTRGPCADGSPLCCGTFRPPTGRYCCSTPGRHPAGRADPTRTAGHRATRHPAHRPGGTAARLLSGAGRRRGFAAGRRGPRRCRGGEADRRGGRRRARDLRDQRPVPPPPGTQATTGGTGWSGPHRDRRPAMPGQPHVRPLRPPSAKQSTSRPATNRPGSAPRSRPAHGSRRDDSEREPDHPRPTPW